MLVLADPDIRKPTLLLPVSNAEDKVVCVDPEINPLSKTLEVTVDELGCGV